MSYRRRECCGVKEAILRDFSFQPLTDKAEEALSFLSKIAAVEFLHEDKIPNYVSPKVCVYWAPAYPQLPLILYRMLRFYENKDFCTKLLVVREIAEGAVLYISRA